MPVGGTNANWTATVWSVEEDFKSGKRKCQPSDCIISLL